MLAADPICQRIGAAVSSGVAKPEQAEQKLPILLQDYKNHLHQGRFDRAMDAMELAAAMAQMCIRDRSEYWEQLDPGRTQGQDPGMGGMSLG